MHGLNGAFNGTLPLCDPTVATPVPPQYTTAQGHDERHWIVYRDRIVPVAVCFPPDAERAAKLLALAMNE